MQKIKRRKLLSAFLPMTQVSERIMGWFVAIFCFQLNGRYYRLSCRLYNWSDSFQPEHLHITQQVIGPHCPLQGRSITRTPSRMHFRLQISRDLFNF